MPEPRFKKRSDVSHVYLPGIGKLREGQVVEGEKYARYCPQFLERTNEPVGPSVPAEPDTIKTKIPPPPKKEEPISFFEEAKPASEEPAPETPKKRKRRKKEDAE